MPQANATFDDLVLGPPISARSCGACVACCKIPEIDEPTLKKKSGTLCPNCTGTSCGIYENRPATCQSYYCVWRRVAALPDYLRPDLINVMFDLARPKPAQNLLTKLYIRGIAYNSWEDFLSPGVAKALEVFKRGKLPVWLYLGDRMRLAHPSDEIAAAILRGVRPKSAAVAVEVAEWIQFHSRF